MGIIVFTFLFLFSAILFLAKMRRGSTKKLPPGSLGLPLVRQSIGLLRAMRANNAEELLRKRMQKYGERNLLELSRQDHKCVRDALTSFLKPESLKHYMEKIDEDVRLHILMNWQGLTTNENTYLQHNLLCSFRDRARNTNRETHKRVLIEGMWSIPVNLPLTRYNHSLRASRIVRKMLTELRDEKRAKFEHEGGDPKRDLITCLFADNNTMLICR